MSQRSDSPEIPAVLPLIPLRDLILFPNLVVPLFVGREKSIKALEEAMRNDHLVALVENETGYRNLCKLLTAGAIGNVDSSTTDGYDCWVMNTDRVLIWTQSDVSN